jgi:LmbE family N-acetylglucosaminyl deacetylase
VKLRIRFRPGLALLCLAIACAAFAGLAIWIGAPWGWLSGAIALFYIVLTAVAGVAWQRCRRLEAWMEWNRPERLLIVAPHQDDCVIGAGGIGIRNARLGGATRILYLVQEEDRATAALRRGEAERAWAAAGVPAEALFHLDLLPPLRTRDPRSVAAAAAELQRLIEEFAPTVVVVPMFEGGHVHHDIACRLIASIVPAGGPAAVFEAPEYSPYVSLRFTPHRVLALCVRWIFALVAYDAPPDGIDDRTVFKVRLSTAELALKKRMLAMFVSQNGASLARTRAYPDRLVKLRTDDARDRPFALEGSYLSFVLRLGRLISNRWALRLFPVQLGTIGREPGITDLSEEFAEQNLHARPALVGG